MFSIGDIVEHKKLAQILEVMHINADRGTLLYDSRLCQNILVDEEDLSMYKLYKGLPDNVYDRRNNKAECEELD